MPINFPTAKFFVFINKLFINNKIFSSQLGYKIIIANKSTKKNNFIIYNNFIYQSLTKNKYITRSVLALKIYRIVNKVNIAIIIKTTLKIIID